MVRQPYFDSKGIKRGAWSEEEDNKLRDCIQRYGHSNWRLLPMFAGLARCGKSCRLRWFNYLKPGLKQGNFTKHERDLIIKLQAQLGNKWSAIAANLPGRTDNEVKNYWHAHIQKRIKRNRPVGKLAAIKNQMPKEDQSSQVNICDIPANQTETPSNIINIPTSLCVENLENFAVGNLAAQAGQGNSIMTDQACEDDLPDPFAQEDYRDNFWFCQEMQNDISVFSESPDAGYYSTAESQLGDFWAEPLGEEAISWYFGDIMDML